MLSLGGTQGGGGGELPWYQAEAGLLVFTTEMMLLLVERILDKRSESTRCLPTDIISVSQLSYLEKCLNIIYEEAVDSNVPVK